MYDNEQNIKFSIQCSDDVETDDNASYHELSGYIFQHENESTSRIFNTTGWTEQNSTTKAPSDLVRGDYIQKSANTCTDEFAEDTIHLESKKNVQPRGPPQFSPYQEEHIQFTRPSPHEYITGTSSKKESITSKPKHDIITHKQLFNVLPVPLQAMEHQSGALEIITHNQGNNIPNICITGDNLKINDINKSHTDIHFSDNHVDRPMDYNIPAIHSIESNTILDAESNISSHFIPENNQYNYGELRYISNSHNPACTTNVTSPQTIPSSVQNFGLPFQNLTIAKNDQMVQRGISVSNNSATKEQPTSAYFRRTSSSAQVHDLIQSSGEESFGSCSDEEQQSRCQGPACGEKGIQIYKNLCFKCYHALADANGDVIRYDPSQNSKRINSCIGPSCPNVGVKGLKRLCEHCFNTLSTIKAKEDKNKLQPIMSRPEDICGQFRSSSDIPWNIYFKSKPPDKIYLIPRSNNEATSSSPNLSSTSRNYPV